MVTENKAEVTAGALSWLCLRLKVNFYVWPFKNLPCLRLFFSFSGFLKQILLGAFQAKARRERLLKAEEHLMIAMQMGGTTGQARWCGPNGC